MYNRHTPYSEYLLSTYCNPAKAMRADLMPRQTHLSEESNLLLCTLYDAVLLRLQARLLESNRNVHSSAADQLFQLLAVMVVHLAMYTDGHHHGSY